MTLNTACPVPQTLNTYKITIYYTNNTLTLNISHMTHGPVDPAPERAYIDKGLYYFPTYF